MGDCNLVIDAMQVGGAPGAIYRFGVEDITDRPITASLHEMDLLASLRFLTSGRRPEMVILGVEPEIIDAGMTYPQVSRPKCPG